MDIFPLKKTIIYLDLNHSQVISSLERKLKDLGAIVEKCFGRDITHLITDRGKAGDYGKHSPSTQQKPSSIESVAPSPFNVNSGWFSGNQDNSPITGSDTAKRPMTRAEAILSKANVTRYYGSSNVIDMARKWNIKIIHLKSAEVWIHKQLERVESIKCKMKQKQLSVENCKVKQLTGIYIKAEDVIGKYRPMKQSFPLFPCIDVASTYTRDIPFLMVSPSKINQIVINQTLKPNNQNTSQLKSSTNHKYKPSDDQNGLKHSACRLCRLQLPCHHRQNAVVGKSKGYQRHSKQSVLLCSSRLGSVCSRTLRNYRVTQLKKYSRRHFKVTSTNNRIPKIYNNTQHSNARRLDRGRPSVRVGDNAGCAAADTSNLKGFCEICDLRYRNLTSHLQSAKHQKFVSDSNNYSSLDKAIAQVPSLSGLGTDSLSQPRQGPTECITKCTSEGKARRSSRLKRREQGMGDIVVNDDGEECSSVNDKASSELPFCEQELINGDVLSTRARNKSSSLRNHHVVDSVSRFDNQSLTSSSLRNANDGSERRAGPCRDGSGRRAGPCRDGSERRAGPCRDGLLNTHINNSVVSCSNNINRLFCEQSDSSKCANNLKQNSEHVGWVKYLSPAKKSKIKLTQPVRLLTNRSIYQQFKESSDSKSFHGFVSDDIRMSDISYTYQSDLSVFSQDFSLSDHPTDNYKQLDQPVARDSKRFDNLTDCNICEFEPIQIIDAATVSAAYSSNRSSARCNSQAHDNVSNRTASSATATLFEDVDCTKQSKLGSDRDSVLRDSRANKNAKSVQPFNRVLFGNKSAKDAARHSEVTNRRNNGRVLQQTAVVELGEEVEFNFSSPQSRKKKISEGVNDDDICFNFDSPQSKNAKLVDVVSVEENIQFNFGSPQSRKRCATLSSVVSVEEYDEFNFDSPQSIKKKPLSSDLVHEQENIQCSILSKTIKKQMPSGGVKKRIKNDSKNSNNCVIEVCERQIQNANENPNLSLTMCKGHTTASSIEEIDRKYSKNISKRMAKVNKIHEFQARPNATSGLSDVGSGDDKDKLGDSRAAAKAGCKSARGLKASLTSDVADCEALQPVVLLRRISQRSNAKLCSQVVMKSDNKRLDVTTRRKSREKHRAAFFNSPHSCSTSSSHNVECSTRQQQTSKEAPVLDSRLRSSISDRGKSKLQCVSAESMDVRGSKDASVLDTELDELDSCDGSKFNPVANWRILQTLSSSRVDWSNSDSIL